jgi:hypothetical protein
MARETCQLLNHMGEENVRASCSINLCFNLFSGLILQQA